MDSNLSQIWNSIKRGDHTAFDRLYRLYADDLYNYGCSLSQDQQAVEDAIQDVFVNLWLRRSKLIISKSMKAYLVTSLRRQLLLNLAKSKQIVLNQNEINEKIEGTNREEDASLIAKFKGIKFLISNLAPREKEAIVLKYQDNFDYEEMEQVMNLKKHAIYKLISRAIKKMKRTKNSI